MVPSTKTKVLGAYLKFLKSFQISAAVVKLKYEMREKSRRERSDSQI